MGRSAGPRRPRAGGVLYFATTNLPSLICVSTIVSFEGSFFVLAVADHGPRPFVAERAERIAHLLAGIGRLDRLRRSDGHLDQIVSDAFQAVRLRRIRIGLGIGGSKGLLPRRDVVACDLGREHEPFGRRSCELDRRDAVHRDRRDHRRANADLAGVLQHEGSAGIGEPDNKEVRIGFADLGELGGEISVAVSASFLGDDLHAVFRRELSDEFRSELPVFTLEPQHCDALVTLLLCVGEDCITEVAEIDQAEKGIAVCSLLFIDEAGRCNQRHPLARCDRADREGGGTEVAADQHVDVLARRKT